jgi:hypothetical protein
MYVSPSAPDGLRGPFFTAGTGISLASGLPCSAMTISFARGSAIDQRRELVLRFGKVERLGHGSGLIGQILLRHGRND